MTDVQLNRTIPNYLSNERNICYYTWPEKVNKKRRSDVSITSTSSSVQTTKRMAKALLKRSCSISCVKKVNSPGPKLSAEQRKFSENIKTTLSESHFKFKSKSNLGTKLLKKVRETLFTKTPSDDRADQSCGDSIVFWEVAFES